jgi:hypothetical protein
MSKENLPKKQLNSVYKYTGMAAKMAAVLLVFTFGGVELDEWVQFKFPVFTLIGALSGSILAIYSMIRDLTK